MFGCRGHSRDQQHGVVHRCLRGLGQGGLPVAPEHIVHTNDIGQKQGIELAPFQQPSKLNPGIEVGIVLHVVFRQDPQAGGLVHHTVHMKGVEIDAFFHCLLLG